MTGTSQANGGPKATPLAGRHFLHVFPSFKSGGVPIRIANVLNHAGPSLRHTIVAMDGAFAARSRLDPGLNVTFQPMPDISRNPLRAVVHLRSMLRAAAPSLLLTYNWGAVEWVLANCLAPVCPHLHFESGFGPEEADSQIPRRVWTRRLALRRSFRLVIPSHTLENIATRVWRIEPNKVLLIPNGVDCERFSRPPVPGVVPGFARTGGETIVGTVAPLRAEKNLSRLIRAFATVAPRCDARLLIAGEGAERAVLTALTDSLGLTDRVIFAGHVERVEDLLGYFDVFAMSSDTEQMPNSLIQAMAAALPVAATDVGDVKRIVSAQNAPFVVPKANDNDLAESLFRLIETPDLRATLGTANQERVRAVYDHHRMFRAYTDLYAAALASR
jgi:glycosyltransferase involved in cell wall biosynthesis